MEDSMQYDDNELVPIVPRVSVMTRQVCEYNIRLARQITDPDHFYEEFQVLKQATEDDIVTMDVVSPGGSLDTCVLFTRAMRKCAAPIMAYIGPTCASAAGAIALNADGWEIDEMSSLMVHTGSFGVGGKTRDVVNHALHQQKMVERFVNLTYSGFLTEEEIEQVLNGKEFYFEGDDLAQRLENLQAYRQELADEQEKED